MRLEKLQDLFDPFDIEWRIGRSGKNKNGIWATALAYVTNRAIMQRLDDICGSNNWQNEYREWRNDSQLCGISIWDSDKKQWITKWDGADNTNFESTKGGLSDSMKRAGYQWGIGRYLYKLPEMFLTCTTEKPQNKDGWNYQAENSKKQIPAFYWKTPDLPDWAIPPQEETQEDICQRLSDWIGQITKEVSHEKIKKLNDLIYSELTDDQYQKDLIGQLKRHLKSIASTYIVDPTS